MWKNTPIRAFALDINFQFFTKAKDATFLYRQDVLGPAWTPQAVGAFLFSVLKVR